MDGSVDAKDRLELWGKKLAEAENYDARDRGLN